MNDQFEFFASCPQGFESLLADELKRLRAQRVRPLKSGVAFFGDRACAYRVCLWSRMASRVTRVLARIDAWSAEALYEGAYAIEWQLYVGKGASVSVSARGTNDALRNSQFTALKVKDALCDRLREERGERPDIVSHRPDVPVRVSVRGGKATVSLDYAGEPLDRRGYRPAGDLPEPPLKETLAAGMLVWGGWDREASPALRRAQAAREGLEAIKEAPAFIDPVCGSGTLVIEAAMMAADRAPGLSRDYWGFEGCLDFDADAFDAALLEADERFEAGLEGLPVLIGADKDPRAVELANECARRLGISSSVSFVVADCADMAATLASCGVDVDDRGFLALDPPSGMRLLAGGPGGFYGRLKEGLEALGSSWRMVAIAPDASIDTALGFDAQRVLPVFKGSSESSLRLYDLGDSFLSEISLVTLSGAERSVAVSSDHASQFAARLRKVAKARRKWAKKNDIHAYRIYDADLPDYAVSVDWFDDEQAGEPLLLVSEYQAPREIDPIKAQRRFKDACAVSSVLLGIPEERLFTRVRRQDKGGSQYRLDEHASHRALVRESDHVFELDMAGHLDTGLFLDHRITRAMVGRMARDARFLNLFAYTGTASVYAAAGGAHETTTVDMSQTYLDWARRNMARAGFDGPEHRFVRADVLSWLEDAAQRGEGLYDVVFVDPPTFSNSKTMGQRTWDIQRDHVALLSNVSSLLALEGKIVFSGNLRSFKIDEQGLAEAGLAANCVTAETIPEDFERNPRIHFCFVIERA